MTVRGLLDVSGQDGEDELWGEAGNDGVDGGFGPDILYGGEISKPLGQVLDMDGIAIDLHLQARPSLLDSMGEDIFHRLLSRAQDLDIGFLMLKRFLQTADHFGGIGIVV